jgi:ABC-2 type transport system permease protein
MLSSLSMVYDREMGSIRILMVSPLPRWFLLAAKLLAGVIVSVLQAYAFLAIALILERSGCCSPRRSASSRISPAS